VATEEGLEVPSFAAGVHLPLVYQGETVGRLVVGLRAPGEAFSQADMRLEDLAREAGAAAQAVRLDLLPAALP
jgi:GAF domain-containing protein